MLRSTPFSSGVPQRIHPFPKSLKKEWIGPGKKSMRKIDSAAKHRFGGQTGYWGLIFSWD